MPNPYHKANGEFASRNELSGSVDNAVARNDAHTYLTERSVLEAPADKRARDEFFMSNDSTNKDDDELRVHDALLPSSTSDSQGLTDVERENVRKKAVEAEEAQQKANEHAQQAQQQVIITTATMQEPEVEEEWEMSW